MTSEGTGRAFFKVWDPIARTWTALSIITPGLATLNYPTWTRDSHYVYAPLSAPRSIVRFDARTRRIETVFNIEGLGESSPWIELDPTGAPMVHRDASQREIVVMDWEER